MAKLLTRHHDLPPTLVRTGLLLVFFASGLAGLIYQSIWAQYLGLLLGHTAYAQALVIAVFMGGMGAGAALAARRSQGWRGLIRAYALVEIVLGIAALLFHGLFVRVHAMLTDQWLGLLPGEVLAEAARWLLGAGLILPQSILLGMSFPLLAAGLIRLQGSERGQTLGSLYFSNSLGAAIGALLAIFLVLPWIGLPGTVQFAGLLNLLVGIAAWVLGSGERQRPPAPHAQPLNETAERGGLLRLVLLATALSSAASFVYELGWIRMLSLAFGTTLHAFELMLAAFIGGIALGGLWVRRRADQFSDPLRAAGWLQVGMGLAALISLAIYADGAFEWVGLLMQGLSRSPAGYAFFNVGTGLAAIIIMMPAAFFAGALLPLLTSLLLRRGHGERVIGQVYAWNTFGAIVGVFAALQLLIPLLGLRNAMLSAAGVDLLIGLALILASAREHPGRLALTAASSVALAGLLIAIGQVHFDPYRLASGVFRTGTDRLGDDLRMVYYRDGKTASVATYESFDGQTRFITHNGKVDASLSMRPGAPTPDEPTMVLAGALPFAYRENVREAAVIGFGSGLTTHTLLADPGLERVDTIEIEERMIEGARHFGHRVERALEDPRSHLVINDAMAVLAASARRYDLIVSEPSNPWMAGVGSLFADEFYRFAASRLSEQGLFVQWIQLYEIDEALVGSVLSALSPHFGDFQAWMANSSDLLIVASLNELPDPELSRLFRGELGIELALVGLTQPEQIRLREFGDRRWLQAITRTLAEPPNSWYYPRLSLEAPRTRFQFSRAERLIRLAEQPSPARRILGIGGTLPAEIRPSRLTHFAAEPATASARSALKELGSGAMAVIEQPAIELLARRSRDCEWLSSNSGQIAWLDAYSSAAESLVPYLGAEYADALGGQGWLECPALPDRIGAALSLASLLVGDDPDALAQASRRWMQLLEHGALPEGLYLSEQAWLAGQAVYLAREDYAGWEDFRLEFIGLVEETDQVRFLEEVLGEYANALLEPAYLP